MMTIFDDKPTPEEIKDLAHILEQGNRTAGGTWLNYWHERPASDCWVKVDYHRLAEQALLGAAMILEDRANTPSAKDDDR